MTTTIEKPKRSPIQTLVKQANTNQRQRDAVRDREYLKLVKQAAENELNPDDVSTEPDPADVIDILEDMSRTVEEFTADCDLMVRRLQWEDLADELPQHEQRQRELGEKLAELDKKEFDRRQEHKRVRDAVVEEQSKARDAAGKSRKAAINLKQPHNQVCKSLIGWIDDLEARRREASAKMRPDEDRLLQAESLIEKCAKREAEVKKRRNLTESDKDELARLQVAIERENGVITNIRENKIGPLEHTMSEIDSQLRELREMMSDAAPDLWDHERGKFVERLKKAVGK